MTFFEGLKNKIVEGRVRSRLRESADDFEDATTGEGIEKRLDEDYVPVEPGEGDGIGGDL